MEATADQGSASPHLTHPWQMSAPGGGAGFSLTPLPSPAAPPPAGGPSARPVGPTSPRPAHLPAGAGALAATRSGASTWFLCKPWAGSNSLSQRGTSAPGLGATRLAAEARPGSRPASRATATQACAWPGAESGSPASDLGGVSPSLSLRDEALEHPCPTGSPGRASRSRARSQNGGRSTRDQDRRYPRPEPACLA